MSAIPGNNPVVRAIDVGYGNTKYTSLYEVGKDAKLAQDATHGRILDADYSMSDPHMALIRGALYYMGQQKIDLLVLGLPVNTFEKYHQALAKRAVGRHQIPSRSKDSATTEVEVANCRVIPQPIGAFFDYASRNGTYDRMRSQMNLLIDIGYYTLDWLVADGVKMINARSGAHNGGMSAVFRTMADAIGSHLGEQISDLSIIEDAIRMGTTPRFYGKEMDITEYIKLGKAKAEQFVSVLVNKVGSAIDISNIILAGGGAEFFRDVLAEKFPRHEIITTVEPVFANVRGFQRAGTQFANQLRKA
jgi:plasmid segregation protein ParM